MAGPRVFTVPQSRPFLKTLAESLVEGRLIPGFPAGDDPLALAAATVYLPNRRACRAFQDVFLDLPGTATRILPRIVPLGDLDDDETGDILADPAEDLAPAIAPVARQLLLTRLVSDFLQLTGGSGAAPIASADLVSAARLAGALARLIDSAETERAEWGRLETLVPEDFAGYWQLTTRFLEIASTAWPAILAERGVMDGAARGDQVLTRAARHLRDTPPAGPIVAAGSTGSRPAVREILSQIARLPNGAVVLPGLDQTLEEADRALILGDALRSLPALEGHPQFGLLRLAREIGVAPEDVVPLGAARARDRTRLFAEALRPAATTDRWASRAERLGDLEPVTGGLGMISAASEQEEALTIALMLRETLEDPAATAIVVTPDRGLGERIAAEAQRFGIAAEMSAGQLVADTPSGVFARLLASLAAERLPPVRLVELLRHPLARLGGAPEALADAVTALELAVLRGPRPAPGIDGLVQALAGRKKSLETARSSDPRRRIAESGWDEAAALIPRLAAALAPLTALDDGGRHPLATLAIAHRDALLALAREDEATATLDPDDPVLALLEAIAESPDHGLEARLGEYPALFEALAGQASVGMPSPRGARLAILGQLEARFQTADLVVLAGLEEGTWPASIPADPWLNRAMRRDFGLPQPEWRIGLAAHDFVTLSGAKRVVFAHARKVAGVPTVPSRWLQRLEAVLGPERTATLRAVGARYLGLARALDRPAAVRPVARPLPRPPLDRRPTRLSVTEIETLLRDPYSIYARHILRLFPLDALDTAPGAADKGTLLHDALDDFAKNHPETLPPDIAGIVRRSAEARLVAQFAAFPDLVALWRPRIARVADWFAEFETERRARIAHVFSERSGKLTIPLGDVMFTLTCRADRIDLMKDGSYAVLDYKSGQLAGVKEVRAGLAPQLPLEAALLSRGAFTGLPHGASVSEIAYVRISGGRPAGQVRPIPPETGTVEDLADEAMHRLTEVLARLIAGDAPFASLVSPQFNRRYGEYDHLARIREWAGAGEGGE